MAETKYGKYILSEPKGAVEEDWGGTNLRMRWESITRPLVKEGGPHADTFDQFLCFTGGEPTDFYDFGAEIELPLGEEGEKHIIDASTSVYIPKGMKYGPINFKRVDKPIRLYTIIIL
jgi:hypothetical protein